MSAALVALILAGPAAEMVREIEVEGLVSVAREVALAGIETRVGQPLDPAAVSRDLRRLWGTYLFREVAAEKEPLADGWRVVFLVSEQPLVRRIQIRGHEGIDEEALLAQVGSEPLGQPLGQPAANADAFRLADYYRSRGFPRVEVTARLAPIVGQSDLVDLVFDVREGPRGRVVALTIDGNNEVPDDVLLDAIQTCEATLLNRLLRGCWYAPAVMQTDLLRIQALYYDRGYVNIRIEAPEVVFSDDGTAVSVRIRVVEDKVYRFGRLEFAVDEEALPVFSRDKLEKLLGVTTGETFDRVRLFHGMESIRTAYQQVTRTAVSIEPNSEMDFERGLVHLNFVIERETGIRPAKRAPSGAAPDAPDPRRR